MSYAIRSRILKQGPILTEDKLGRSYKKPKIQAYQYGIVLGYFIGIISFCPEDILSKNSGSYAILVDYSLKDVQSIFKMVIEKLQVWNEKIKKLNEEGKLTEEQKRGYYHFMQGANIRRLVPILEL